MHGPRWLHVHRIWLIGFAQLWERLMSAVRLKPSGRGVLDLIRLARSFVLSLDHIPHVVSYHPEWRSSRYFNPSWTPCGRGSHSKNNHRRFCHWMVHWRRTRPHLLQYQDRRRSTSLRGILSHRKRLRRGNLRCPVQCEVSRLLSRVSALLNFYR